MFGSKKACPERAELEKKISECIGSLAELTVNGPGATPKQEAGEKPADELIAFQKVQVALSARLRALRECLESHRDWHHC
jgi:hypothetical protein